MVARHFFYFELVTLQYLRMRRNSTARHVPLTKMYEKYGETFAVQSE